MSTLTPGNTLPLIAALILLAACGGDSSSDNASGSSTVDAAHDRTSAKRIPPPVPLNADPVAAGTPAPDGIGVAVRDNTRTVGEMNAETMTYTPWEDESVINPLPVGASMPADSKVLAMDGTPFDLNAAVADKPTVLIFYRGGWCPYCNAHLRELQQSAPALEEMGYQLLAISPDAPEQLRSLEKDANLSYQLLSDKDVTVAAGFGLRYKLSQQYIDHVVSTPSQTNLATQNDGYMLTPGAFVLDTNGVVRFAYVNNNYTVRVSQTALLDAAREALASDAAESEANLHPPLSTLDGKALTLGSFRDKTILVNFWATWCGPCRKEMPELDHLAQRLDPDRAIVLGIAADERAVVGEFLDHLGGVRYPIAIGEPDQMFAWSTELGNLVQALPFSVLLDGKGDVTWVKTGELDFEELTPLLAAYMTTGEKL